MKFLRLAAAILVMVAYPCLVLAQQAILQGGPWKPGHAPMYVGAGSSQPIVQDSGPAGGGGPGVGISELGLTVRGSGTPPYANAGTGPFGTNLCDFDAPITNSTGYHFLCFSPNAQNGGLIAYGAAGGAATQPLNMNVNGVNYQFPFVLSGVVGPPTTVSGDVACWNNSQGTLLSDCGTLNSVLQGAYTGITQVNQILFGSVAAANPYIGSNGNFPLSFQANGKEFLRGFDAGSGNMKVYMNQNSDPSIAQWFNLGNFVVAGPDTHNSFVAMATNNSAPGTVAFPTAITGIAYNKSNGNTAFGIYAEGHAAAQGTVPATEFAAFQDSVPASTTYPFDNSIGTTQTTAKSIQATAGTSTAVTITGTTTSASTSVTALSSTTGLYVGMYVSGTGIPAETSIVSINTSLSSMVISHPATATGSVSLVNKSPAGVALEIGPEGSTFGSFQYGIAVNASAVRQYSYWQDGQGDNAPVNGMYMAYAGSGVGMRIRAVGTSSFNQNNNNGVLQIDSGIQGDGVFTVRQDGDVSGHAWISNLKTGPTISTCTGVGTGGTCTLDTGSNDGSGTVTITAGTSATPAGGSIGLTFNVAIGSHSSNCFLQTAGGTATWAAGSSLNISSQSNSAVNFFWLNGVPTGTALTAANTYKINYFCAGH